MPMPGIWPTHQGDVPGGGCGTHVQAGLPDGAATVQGSRKGAHGAGGSGETLTTGARCTEVPQPTPEHSKTGGHGGLGGPRDRACHWQPPPTAQLPELVAGLPLHPSTAKAQGPTECTGAPCTLTGTPLRLAQPQGSMGVGGGRWCPPQSTASLVALRPWGLRSHVLPSQLPPSCLQGNSPQPVHCPEMSVHFCPVLGSWGAAPSVPGCSAPAAGWP